MALCKKCGAVEFKCNDCGHVFCAHCDNNSSSQPCPKCKGYNTEYWQG